jgi:plastocyanin
MKALAVAAMLTLSLSVVAGCGGSSKKSNASTTATTSTTGTATKPAGGGATTLHLDADPSGALKFIGPDGAELGTGAKNGLKATAGSVTLEMANPSTVAHAIAVKGTGIQRRLGPTVGKDGLSTVNATLKPGKYEFYCPVDGHESAGMKGILIVR